MSTKNAILYIRVSTEKQAEHGASLETQEQSCLEWCHRFGILPLQIFRDEGKSAKTLNRPEMTRMLEYISKNSSRIDYLVIYQMDRLTRSALDYYELVGALKDKEIGVRDTSSNPISGESDDLVRGINILIGDHENKLKSRRIKENMSRKAQDGYRMHKAPYGLRNIRDIGGNSSIEPIPEIAPKISQLLYDFSTGLYTKGLLAKRSEDIGLKQANGKMMSIQYIDKLLNNAIYGGLEKNSLTDNEYVDSIFEGIIPKHIFLKNQEILYGDSNKMRGKYKVIHPDYPLRGLITCAECDTRLTASASTGNGGKKYPRYTCRNKACKRGYVTPLQAHEQFLDLLASLTPSARKRELLKTLVTRKWAQQNRALRSDRQTLQKKQAQLDESRLKASEKFVSNDLAKDDYDMLKSKYKNSAVKIENQLLAIDKKLKLKQSDIDYALEYLGNVPKIWSDASVGMKIVFQNMIFPAGVPYDLQKKEFGTAKLSALYTLASMKKDPSKADESLLVIPRRIELLLPG